MNKYCLVIDGVIVKEPTSLPTRYKDEATGVNISGFNNLDNSSLLQYGWLPVVIDDSDRGQYAVENGHTFEIQDNQVIQINKYCNMTQEEFEQRESALRDALKTLKQQEPRD
jgi:hypothetical protein